MIWNKISKESRIYILSVIISIFILFLITSVIFMALIADKLDIVVNQSAKITYTYFISIMDRLLALFIIFIILPVTIYQMVSKNKSNGDKTVSSLSLFILLAFIFVFLGGEYNFYKTFKNGELNSSQLFNSNRIEFKIFNYLR